MKIYNLIILLAVISLFGCEQFFESRIGREITDIDKNAITGNYLGQQLPDSIPVVFAPGIICNGLNNRDITMTPDGNEIYFTNNTPGYSYAAIFVIKRDQGVWSNPEVVSFGNSTDYISIEPCLSIDGNTLFYASDKPVSDTSDKDDMNIWKVERTPKGWTNPILLNLEINTGQGEYYPSVTKSGTMYFTREEENRINFIYRSRFIDGAYSTPEKLPAQIQCGHNRFNAYIAPDESFLIIPAIGVEKSVGGVNYYISFRDKDDNWSHPINMGNTMNENLGRGWSASLSHDGSFLFFMSSKGLDSSSVPDKLTTEFFNGIQTSPQNGNSDIYWMSAEFIKDLKKKAVYEN